jgi:hypothetical protein
VPIPLPPKIDFEFSSLEYSQCKIVNIKDEKSKEEIFEFENQIFEVINFEVSMLSTRINLKIPNQPYLPLEFKLILRNSWA